MQPVLFQEVNGKKTVQLKGSMRIKDNNSVVINNSDFQITLQNIDLTNRNFTFDTSK